MASKQKDHFIEFFDNGRTENLVFIVMGLVGPSIDDLRRHVLQRDAFSQSTAVNISLQTLQAVRDLHTQCGYLHRDIKPHNFAIGHEPDKQAVVYMLDFGIARSFYVDKNNKQMVKPRDKVRFIGTVRYAPRSCHRQRDQGRKDDVEAWLYLSYELFSKDTLVWRRLAKKDEVGTRKKEFFENACKHEADPVYKSVPAEYHKQLRYVDSLTYYDEPNYADIYRAILTAAKRLGIDMEAPLDWIGRDIAAAMARKSCGKDTREEHPDDDDPFDRKKGTKGTKDTHELNEPDDKRNPDGEGGNGAEAGGEKSTILKSVELPK
ncbi:CK1/DUAL protein kinase [Aphelenchoides avenae]|nr:CK1/DUAL protein kinase [Aphelenchus avenae]